MTLDFLRPARMDDVLKIVTKPEAVKGVSIILHQT
jgi:acyl-CoA thioesterase FadM